MTLPRRVIKLGGSLLPLTEMVPQLRSWLGRQTPAANTLIVGGGAAADVIRQLDQLHGLTESVAHWLCIRMMSVQAELIASLLPEATLVRQLSPPNERETAASLAVLDVEPFLRDCEPIMPGTTLPHGWHVTSDSIAARVAEIVGSRELVLLKSQLPAPDTSTTEWAAAGYVDQYFPQAASELPRIRCVNLRAGCVELAFPA